MTGAPEEHEDDEFLDGEAVEVTPPRPWSPRAQLIAAVLWPSFLAASFATMVFFAFVDPGILHEDAASGVESTRMMAYGVTFFFFWAVTAISSGVSVYLLHTASHADREQDGPG